jgi:hypothetical protein
MKITRYFPVKVENLKWLWVDGGQLSYSPALPAAGCGAPSRLASPSKGYLFIRKWITDDQCAAA